MRAGTTKPIRRDGSGRWRGRLLLNLALLLASGLLCLLAAEGVLRDLYPPEPVFVREHPAFGFANIPNQRGDWRRETERPPGTALATDARA